jgi:hypothetical protein
MPLLAALAAALTVTVWPQGPGGPSYARAVRCPGSADCARLARVQDPFAPVPAGTACTQIYGGAQVALVRGTYRGRRVWARFRRSDGCEIARWQRVDFLFRRA